MVEGLAERSPAVKEFLNCVGNGGVLSLSEVDPAAQPFLVALLHRAFPDRQILVVTSGVKAQEAFHQDVETLGSERGEGRRENGGKPEGPNAEQKQELGKGKAPLFFPGWDILPHEPKLPHADVISERLETLVSLAHASPTDAPVIVATVVALMQKTYPPGHVAQHTRVIRKREVLNPLDLVEWLEDEGYEPEAQVNHKSELALRGGILDVFPPTLPWPVRIEFFGDEIESIREFDPITQMSRDEVESVTIPPAGELGILKRQIAASADTRLATLFDHVADDAIVVVCDPTAVRNAAEDYAIQVPDGDPFLARWDEMEEHGVRQAQAGTNEPRVAARHAPPSGSWVEFLWQPEANAELSNAEQQNGNEEEAAGRMPALPAELVIRNLDAFRPITERAPDLHVAEAQRREFFAQLHRWERQGYAVHVFCNTAGERQRFEEVWQEYGFPRADVPVTHLGTLSRGFIFDEARLIAVTDAEIFGRYKVQRPRRLKSRHAAASRSALDIDFTEFEEGDYVVHVQHGIGRFRGVQVFEPGAGRKPTERAKRSAGQECLVIEYAAPDPEQPPPKLYVPVSEAHLVSKYVGAGKARPQLNTLGGTRWAKTKAQAENAVRDLAAEMLRIQAARESQAGYPFGEDNTWQREFEGSFLYEETPDQMRAIVETKKDMERPKPMDRLICGDVGYGKTEVAIRAAFKAVMGGKQVAVLVPTTVLAQQHFNTFSERMADYPVRVEILSRFRSAREQRRVIDQLAAGGVDIVIGTHRLVQKDIVFKDLGLVVIDEEQRFGVMHKEKFKMLRQLVDVLTLSATPIPRTLYLALTGARDMSTIETPPQDRLPVETVVTQYDERLIRDAIQRELNRQGQVFYLHNRVFDIEAVALKLRALVPHARILVGHGQMDADDLEKVMTKFVNGEADVLLSTTIIESGIDIPNANTIIIDRADRFGLSDLYQLRGRVGRYKHQAYAYLMLPRHAGLLTDARKRISAIKQYSSLGSGFKIAMRDLEIRGAGNLLGAQQSGHITAVGFDLYCQLLKQSVSSLKGQKVRPRVEVQARIDFLAFDPAEVIEEPLAQPTKKEKPEFVVSVPRETATWSDFDFDEPPEEDEPEAIRRAPAYIPLDYIRDPKPRIEFYRKLAQATDKASVQRVAVELRDRFGPLPHAVDTLLQVTDLKLLAAEKGISSVETRGNKLMLTQRGDLVMVEGKFPRLTKRDAAGRLKEIRKLVMAL